MAYQSNFQVINVGVVANDGTGDPLRSAFIKVNTNFSEVSATFGQVYGLIPTDINGNPIPMAPLNSPHFTGDPQVPTPPTNDDDKSIANTEWVRDNFVDFDPNNLPPAGTDLSAYAPLNSPVFTGDPRAPTPAPGDNDTSIATTAWVTAAISGGGGGNGNGEIPPIIAKAIGATAPEGRLTLTSHGPVMVNTVIGATTIYYTPYIGTKIPLFDGTDMLATRFDEISALVSDATHNPTNGIAAGKIHDWFVWKDTSVTPNVLRLTHGPDWADNVTRSAGSGLTRIGGIWVNTTAITNGPAAQRGTYVGTTYCAVTNQLIWQLGGANLKGRFHVWNAYNRVNVGTSVTEPTFSWSTSVTTWRLMNNNANIRVEAVQGLQEDSIDVTHTVMCSNGSSQAFSAIGLDWVSGDPTPPSIYTAEGPSTNAPLIAHHVSQPLNGFHYWQAIEHAGIGACTFYGSDAAQWAAGMTFNARM